MHLVMLLSTLVLAWWLRTRWSHQSGRWHDRWQATLKAFLLPPLLLLTTSIAIIWMGPVGTMVAQWDGWLSYTLSLLAVPMAVGLGGKLAFAGWRSLRQISTYPSIQLQEQSAYLLPSAIPFLAQVGFWQPKLVVTQGLLDVLSSEHLEAALTHEQAHFYYRDTFWFFWLGWLRRLTHWLPQTTALWQELLLLRELRADQWAAQIVDSLLLAEALLSVSSQPQFLLQETYAAFGEATISDESTEGTAFQRLRERVDALLTTPEVTPPANVSAWGWLLLGFLPLTIIPFHH